LVLVAAGCTPAGPERSSPTPPSPTVTPIVSPDDFDAQTAVAAVHQLAGKIGPRHATSPAFRESVAWVGRELSTYGLAVRRQSFAVPGGNSWGVPVSAGRSVNVIATPPGFDAGDPHVVVGAHLDTVPQAPGAEDNASGIGVLLATAKAIEVRRTRLPVVLIAFGAEEPRGPTDDDHHYGSRAYVASLTPAERRAVRGMLSLDRVGVGSVVPVGAADGEPTELLRAAERAGVPVKAETGQRSSDHWSFVRAGLPGLRVGSTPYAEYHSAADRPDVITPAQLRRTGQLVLTWLAPITDR
jgi:aminopeptidase YwaD